LGTPPSGRIPGVVQVVYADQPLTITGAGNSGFGILLVNGNLTVSGNLNYQGIIIVNGQINITPPSSGNIIMSGAVVGAGTTVLNAPMSLGDATISTLYNSCAVALVLAGASTGTSSGSSSSSTSPQILCYRELSY
jgi:uncharacterized protein (DUF342 family)